MANLKIKHAILTLRENFNCILWQILSLQYRTSTWSYICNFVYISHEKKHALKWKKYCKLLVTTLVVSEVHQWMLPKSASRFSWLVSSNLKDLCIKIEFTWNKNQHLFLLCNNADSDFSFPFYGENSAMNLHSQLAICQWYRSILHWWACFFCLIFNCSVQVIVHLYCLVIVVNKPKGSKWDALLIAFTWDWDWKKCCIYITNVILLMWFEPCRRQACI